jgi:hypothetical protein
MEGQLYLPLGLRISSAKKLIIGSFKNSVNDVSVKMQIYPKYY